jgi:phage N-6-adenine-methyltransferase
MKMNQKGRGNDCFQTPYYLFEQLDRIFNFTLDVAASENNHLYDYFFTEENNALEQNWGEHRAFCNPPFSQKAEFIKKAVKECQEGRCPICVMILPLNSMDTKVWHEFIEGHYHYEILKGRISFIDPDTQMPKRGNNSGTVIVYFKRKIEIM